MATLSGASQPYLGAVQYYFLLLLILNAHSIENKSRISIFRWELAVYCGGIEWMCRRSARSSGQVRRDSVLLRARGQNTIV